MKKCMGILLVSVMIVSLFIGCSKKEVKIDSNDATAQQGTVDETKSNNKEEQNKEVNLKLLISQPRFREQYESYFNIFCEKYEEETGIKVTYDLEMPSADQGDEILKTRLATKDTIDIFALHAINDIPQFYKAGYLEDLSDNEFVNNIIDSAKSSVTIDNKVVAVPLESLTWGYLYNKEIFEELGLKPAMTLAEMEANIEVLKDAGKTPFLLSYNEAWIPQLFTPLTVGAIVSTSYNEFLEKMNNDKSSFSEVSYMFDIIDIVNANGNKNAFEVGGSDGCAEFANGNYGMWIQGPWFSETILAVNEDFKLGVAPLPISNNEEETKVNVAVSTSLAVSKYSENKEVAKALVDFMIDEKHTNEFFMSVQFNPISKYHTYDSFPWVDEATKYAEEGKAYNDLTIPSAVKDESGKMLQEYFAGTASKEDVINALDLAWKNFNKIDGQ